MSYWICFRKTKFFKTIVSFCLFLEYIKSEKNFFFYYLLWISLFIKKKFSISVLLNNLDNKYFFFFKKLFLFLFFYHIFFPLEKIVFLQKEAKFLKFSSKFFLWNLLTKKSNLILTYLLYISLFLKKEEIFQWNLFDNKLSRNSNRTYAYI